MRQRTEGTCKERVSQCAVQRVLPTGWHHPWALPKNRKNLSDQNPVRCTGMLHGAYSTRTGVPGQGNVAKDTPDPEGRGRVQEACEVARGTLGQRACAAHATNQCDTGAACQLKSSQGALGTGLEKSRAGPCAPSRGGRQRLWFGPAAVSWAAAPRSLSATLTAACP